MFKDFSKYIYKKKGIHMKKSIFLLYPRTLKSGGLCIVMLTYLLYLKNTVADSIICNWDLCRSQTVSMYSVQALWFPGHLERSKPH